MGCVSLFIIVFPSLRVPHQDEFVYISIFTAHINFFFLMFTKCVFCSITCFAHSSLSRLKFSPAYCTRFPSPKSPGFFTYGWCYKSFSHSYGRHHPSSIFCLPIPLSSSSLRYLRNRNFFSLVRPAMVNKYLSIT